MATQIYGISFSHFSEKGLKQYSYMPHCFDIVAAKPLCPDCLVRLQPFVNGFRFALCSECRRLWEEWGEYAYRIRWTKRPDSGMLDRSGEVDEDWEKKVEVEFGLESASLQSVAKDMNSVLR